MVPRLQGWIGYEGVMVAVEPSLAIWTLRVRAVGQAALLVGTSE